MPDKSRNMLIVIPAWNEEKVLGPVLEEVKTAVQDFADILVVSDGSTDATASIAKAAGVAVLDLPLNLGVGGAMRAGYVYAVRKGYDYAVQLDADGQHDPHEIPGMLDALKETGADLMIGARFVGKGEYEAHGLRMLAMKFLSAVLSRICATRLTDTTSGFKLSNRAALSYFSKNSPAEYLGDTIEALVMAARDGLVVRQTAVEMRPRAGGTPSHGGFASAKFLMRAFLALGIAITRPKSGTKLEREVQA